MSAAVEALRAELGNLRERLVLLQREEATSAAECDDLERRLVAERRRREELARQVRSDESAIEAVQAALTVLTERLPTEIVSAEEKPTMPVRPVVKAAAERVSLEERRARLPKNPTALKILRDAEELDSGDLSQRSRERAEMIRRILARSQDPVAQTELVAAVLREGSITLTESKARTAVEVGLTVLVADGRVRCVSAASETWELTPAERASANMGIQIAGFRGRTTVWPNAQTSPPAGTLIKLEEGSYEGGKKR